jgi:uncharacterized pyridoxamine 5'-phosphate oxidase family protein
MTEKKVSIIIPCYNSKNTIRESIKTALNQTYQNKEVVVVNDGSTDGSKNIIKKFGSKIKYCETKNKGAPRARNIGIKVSNGEFVKFLDADDRMCLESVEKQVNQSVKLSKSHKIVFGNAKYVNSDNKVIKKTNFEEENRITNPLLRIRSMNIQTSLPLHKKKLLEKVNGFDESLTRGQEYDLHFRLVASGVRFVYWPTWVVRVLCHDGTDRISTQDHFSEDPRGRLRRIRERVEVAEECNLLDNDLRRNFARSAWHAGRMAVRKGFQHIAEEYFTAARSLHPDHIASSSQIYRSMVRVADPQVAEWVAVKAKSVVSETSVFN